MRRHHPTSGHPHARSPRWRRGWMLVRGIHRQLLSIVFLATGLGGLGGYLLHGAEGSHIAMVGIGGLLASWMLAWVATRRIAMPVHRLAKVAAELHGGRLRSRDQLTDETAELGELSRSLRGMAERLEQQLDDQRALMAAVSHELRSPLGRARVLVELIREGPDDESCDDLQAEIDAMDSLVGDLLAAARIDFAAVASRPLSPLQLATQALEAEGLPAEMLAVSGDLEDIQADPTLVARALHVLLDNGAGHGGGVVALVVEGHEEGVRFAVEDAGPGFAPGDEEQAFAPFWRGRGARPPGEGLGLALVRRIAQVHGGTAGAENRAEGGARCWMRLPR